METIFVGKATNVHKNSIPIEIRISGFNALVILNEKHYSMRVIDHMASFSLVSEDTVAGLMMMSFDRLPSNEIYSGKYICMDPTDAGIFKLKIYSMGELGHMTKIPVHSAL